jgi:hypothetical protein
MRDVLDALQSFEAAVIEVGDVVAAGKEPAGQPFTAKIARAGLRKVAGAGAGEMFFDDSRSPRPDGGHLSVKRFALNELQLAPVLEGAPIPGSRAIEARGVAADIPDPRTSETSSRMKFSVENASATFANFLATTPTKFSGRVDNFVVDLSARGETQTTSHFLALGYRELALSGVAAGEWREKTSEAALEPVAIDAKNMGVAHLSALFGNVSSAAFSSSPLISRAATLATSIKSIDLTLEGDGLVDRVLALEAKERRRPSKGAPITPGRRDGDYGARRRRGKRQAHRQRGLGLHREAEALASALCRAKGRQRHRRAGAKARRNSGKPSRWGRALIGDDRESRSPASLSLRPVTTILG